MSDTNDNNKDTVTNSEYNQVIDESLKLLDALYTKEDSVHELVSNTDRFRENIMSFVSAQLNDITKKDMMTRLVDAELIRKIALHELPTKDILDLRTTLSIDKNTSIQSVLDLFKPSNGNGTNTLLPPPKVNEEDNSELLKKLTPESRAVLNKLMLVVENLVDKDTNTEEENK